MNIDLHFPFRMYLSSLAFFPAANLFQEYRGHFWRQILIKAICSHFSFLQHMPLDKIIPLFSSKKWRKRTMFRHKGGSLGFYHR